MLCWEHSVQVPFLKWVSHFRWFLSRWFYSWSIWFELDGAAWPCCDWGERVYFGRPIIIPQVVALRDIAGVLVAGVFILYFWQSGICFYFHVSDVFRARPVNVCVWRAASSVIVPLGRQWSEVRWSIIRDSARTIAPMKPPLLLMQRTRADTGPRPLTERWALQTSRR